MFYTPKKEFQLAFCVTNNYKDSNMEAELTGLWDCPPLLDNYGDLLKNTKGKGYRLDVISGRLCAFVVSATNKADFFRGVQVLIDFCKDNGITPTKAIDRTACPSVEYMNDWLEYVFEENFSMLELEDTLANMSGLKQPYKDLFSQSTVPISSSEEFNPGRGMNTLEAYMKLGRSMSDLKNSVDSLTVKARGDFKGLCASVTEREKVEVNTVPESTVLSGLWS